MHMHIGTFRRIVDEAEILGVPSIKLNLRGESTLHPYFFEACRYVKNKFIDIRINTNGNYPSTINHYMADTFTEISVSVDADNPLTYGRIRKGGRLAVVEDNILRLYNMMNHSKQTLRLSFVITKTNRKQVESFVIQKTGELVDRGAYIPLDQILIAPLKTPVEFSQEPDVRSFSEMIEGRTGAGAPGTKQGKPGKRAGWDKLGVGAFVAYQAVPSGPPKRESSL